MSASNRTINLLNNNIHFVGHWKYFGNATVSNNNIYIIPQPQTTDDGEQNGQNEQPAQQGLFVFDDNTLCKLYLGDNKNISKEFLTTTVYMHLDTTVRLIENVEYKYEENIVENSDHVNIIAISLVLDPDIVLKYSEYDETNENCYFAITVQYNEASSDNASNVVTTANSSMLGKNVTVVHSIPVSQPLVQNNSKVIYIEDSINNTDKTEYTHFTKLQTANGENIYGVKRLPFFMNGFEEEDYVAKEKANIDAEIVILTPKSSQKQIYSFKNGPQYAEINRSALKYNESKELDGKIIPHYIHSYEYIIDSIIPQTDDSNDTNLRFYGSNGIIGSESIMREYTTVGDIMTTFVNANDDEVSSCIDNILSYTFTVDYRKSTSVPSGSFEKVRTVTELTPIQNNIVNASTNSSIYENTYHLIDDIEVYKKYTDVIELYVRSVTYEPLLLNTHYTLNDINSNISAYADIADSMQNTFYKYDSKKRQYVQVLSNINTTDKLYAKCIAYTKVSSNINAQFNSHLTAASSNDSYIAQPESIYYVQDYKYTPVEDKEHIANKELYYIKKTVQKNNGDNLDIYYPVQPGIVSDGSINYYSYTYVKLSNDRVANMKADPSAYEGTYVYLKLEYSSKNINDFTDADFNNMYTYEGSSIIFENVLGNDNYIFDVDPSGATIYSKPPVQEGLVNPIDKADLESFFFYDAAHDWTGKDMQSETALNNLHKYSLPANYGINGTLNYNGQWKKINRTKLRDTLGSEDDVTDYLISLSESGKLFVKERGYSKIDISEMIIGYDIDFYVWEIGKLDPSQVTSESFLSTDSNKKIYVDCKNFINENNDNAIRINSDDTCKLLEVNKFGLIPDDSVQYYTREPEKTVSHDLFYFVNKEYYFNKSTQAIVSTGTTPKIPVALLAYESEDSASSGNISTFTSSGDCSYIKLKNDFALHILRNCNYVNKLFYMNNGKYTLVPVIEGTKDVERVESTMTTSYYLRVSTPKKPEDIVSFSDSEAVHLCSDELFNGYEFIEGTLKFYRDSISQYDLNGEFIKKADVMSYTNKFLYSKYFYPDLTVNNGIHLGKDGSYYTAISVYDADRGKISRTLALQPNVFNVTEYTYEYTVKALVDLADDEDLTNISQSHYLDYYIYGDNVEGIQQLTPEGNSPSYYQNYFANVDGVNHIGTYKEKTKTEKYDGHSFGPSNDLRVQYFDNVTFEPKVIKRNNTLFGIIFHTNLSSFFNDGQVIVNDDMIIHPTSKLFMSPLYEFNPTLSYEYSVVPLKEYIIEDYDNSDDMTVIQPNKTITKDITIPTPVHLANEIQVEFTGTYHWNMPEHSYVFTNVNGEYIAQDIIKTTGYWERDYSFNTQPLQIASYNFYSDPTKISSTTVSYSFTPESYVVNAVTVHPNISYKYIVDETREVERYSYILNGKEYEYPSTSVVQVNSDGTYTGAITIQGRSSTTSKLVDLIKHIDVDVSPVVKEVVHQEEFISYNIASYKTSLALTNERVPVLYSTEIIPATTHKVLYWNEDAESYAMKTVVDTYAYYSYNYKFDLVPFVVSSYVAQQAPFTIENMYDLAQGAYSIADNIVYASQSNVSGFNNVKEAVNKLGGDLTNSLTSTYTQISTLSTNLGKSIDKVADYIKTYSTGGVVNSSKSYAYEIAQNIDIYTYEFKSTVSSLEKSINNLKTSIDSKMSYMTDSIVSIVNKTLVSNGDSIAKILSRTQSGVSSYGGTVSTVTRDYESFMIELTKMMYSKIDFDKEIVETERRDENGNILERAVKKANPIALAKATIYRADILWNELKKKNIV